MREANRDVESEAPAATRGRPRVRLLLVEDDPVDRMAFERFVRLENQPYDYTLAGSLGEAEELLEHQRYDVVLTDYHLGDGDALAILRHDLEVPVVVVTGAGDEETAIRAMRAGAFDYLIKDTERGYLKMLAVTVESAYRHHRTEAKARMLSQAVECLNDAIFISDLNDRLTFVNSTFLELYGYAEDEILGRKVERLWADGEHELRPTAVTRLPPEGEQGECLHRLADGTAIPILLSRSPIYDDRGVVVAAVGASRDITTRKHGEKALRESEERYALAAAGANDGLWDWDLKSGKVHYSPRWKLTLGYREDEIGDTPDSWFDLVHPEDVDRLKAQLEAHLHGKTPHFENEHRMRTQGGEYRWVQTRGLAVRDAADEVYRMAGSQRDITDKKRAEQQLSHAALHDPLTDLPNRTLFLDRLGHAVQRARRRSSYSFGVIFLDLDRFKVVNDSLGHAAGDQLLTAIARRLESCLRMGDTVARLGGDEFSILLEDLEDERQIDRVAERIQKSLEDPFDVSGHEIFTTASLGIALSTNGYERPEDILRDADTAMFRAKSLGRTRKVIFTPDMHHNAMTQLELESELRHVLERRELELHYQPILALEHGRLIGFEALVRWRHPRHGLMPPGDFLPAAHETGQSMAIGGWVLREACRQLRRWQKAHPESAAGLTVSVNLDATMLANPEVIELTSRALAESEIAAELLLLDLTEGMVMQNPEVTTSILYRLRELSVRLHVDDFGTGYSSLSQLHRFPIDALKIDRSFISRMSVDREDLEIVRTIVNLAQNLGLVVVAEGIETVDQLAHLRTLGCELGQGFLFARPLQAEDAERIIVEGPPSLPALVVRPEADSADHPR